MSENDTKNHEKLSDKIDSLRDIVIKLESKIGSLLDKDNKIKELEKENQLLTGDIEACDVEVTELKQKINELETVSPGNIGIQPLIIKKEDIKDFLIQMLRRALHNVNITTPTIIDLADLEVYDIKSTVNVNASCAVDQTIDEEQELLQEFEAFDNITLRHFGNKDRWICLKDNEELFFAAVDDNNEDDNLVLYCKNNSHVKLFNSLVMESWSRARKL